jgi:hypothetical protein
LTSCPLAAALAERLRLLAALFRSQTPREMSSLPRLGTPYAVLRERLDGFQADLGAHLAHLPGDSAYARRVLADSAAHLEGAAAALDVEIERALDLPMPVVEYHHLCVEIVRVLLGWARAEVSERSDGE